MLKKYTLDPTHVVDWRELVVDANGTFEEGPVSIVDSLDQVLQSKTVRLVKVLWQHRGIEETTWEREDNMGTRRHHACQPSFLVQGKRYVLVIDIK